MTDDYEVFHYDKLVTFNERIFNADDRTGRERNTALSDRHQYLQDNPEAQQYFGAALMSVIRNKQENTNG